MSEKYTVVHKKSRVLVDGAPKLPSASTLEYGEIAINYAEGHETLSIKNSNNEIATFSSDSTVASALTQIQSDIEDIQSALTEDELVISTSLSDLNDRVEDLESVSIPHNTSDLNNDSGFITSADTAHTHTAAEVGAMATSERSNYLPTGTTLDNVADGSTRKLSDYSTTAHTHTAAEVGAMATSERGNYLTTATTIPNVDNYFDDVEYDSNTKRINFKHGATVKDYIDATDFIKDGMVDSVAISTPTGGTNSGVTCLVVTFNTDAGKDDIEIPLSSIFNPSNYYNKTETDENFLSKSAYTEDEEVIASALNDLNDRIENMSVPEYVSELINDNAYISSAETEERYSLTSHTHSQYATTAHTHTAAEVGAMATSERSNYLPTGTTLDNVADGTTRKLSNYSTTAHSHTAAEVGAMAASERSNYSTTGHTHSQYATTAHTHDYLPLSGGDMTGDFYVINPSNDLEHTQFKKNGITFSKDSSTAIHLEPGWLSGVTFGSNLLFFPEKTGMIATLDDIPGESDLTSSGFTKNGLTSADTANVFLAISGTTTYAEITAARNSGKVLLAKDETHTIHTYQSQTYNVGHVFSCAQTTSSGDILVSRLVCNQSNQWTETTYYVPNESDIASSGFTKNGITGINVNGTASTVTNGVANITIPSGLPAVTASDNGKILQVVNGAWTLVSPTTVYTGTDVPLSSVGNDGDIYLQTS